MKALPPLRTQHSEFQKTRSVWFTEQRSGQDAKGHTKNFETTLLLQISQLDKCTVWSNISLHIPRVIISEWSGASWHSFRVSGFQFLLLRVQSEGLLAVVGIIVSTRGTMSYPKLKALATAYKIIHKTAEIIRPMVTFLSWYMKIRILLDCKIPGCKIVREENLIHIFLFSSVWKRDL